MKTKTLMVVAAVLSMASAASAHDFDPIFNGMGDMDILTLGGFTFAKSVSVDLAPTNAPKSDAQYSIRCQVVYKDNKLPRPETDEEKVVARATGRLLNIWLKELVADQCVDAEYSDLIVSYYDKQFAKNLNKLFPVYVAEKIAEMDDDVRIDVSAVTVTVKAEGEFYADLVELWRQQTPAQQD